MKFKSFLKLYNPAVLIFVGLLSFTIYAWQDAMEDFRARTNKIFEQRVLRVAEAIENRMIDYAQILRGCQSLFSSSEEVNPEEWRMYVRGLSVSQNYPGIQGLAVSRYLPVQDSIVFLKELKKVHPGHSITSSYQFDVMAPVIFIEPLDKRNERAVGFDLYSETERRAAIKRAIVTKQPAITRKIKLRQETQTDVQPGFLMFLPLFSDTTHSKVTGFVANVFRTYDLMGPLLNRYPEVDIQLYDGKQLSNDHLIYQKILARKSRNRSTELVADTTIIVAGLPWRLIVKPNENFGSEIERQQPFLILAVGLILSILAFVVSYNNIKRKIRITEELERSLALERKKDEFISIASHELKTPLTSIKASVQIMERVNLGEREKFMLLKARKNIDKLQGLIGDLLDISKIQAGQLLLNKEDFNIADLVHESIESVSHIYHTHKIEVLNNIPDITYHGDKFRLEQAVNNLLINAIKYSPAASRVYVQVNKVQSDIKIDIIDEGIGISKQDLRKIFDRFYRAAELSPVISGLGIGLHISNEIVKRHNGQIEVKSEIKSGSVFTIVLPLS